MQVAQSYSVREIKAALEKWAPPVLQESYDNSGLLVGDLDASITKVMVSLDCTESVVDEAVALGAQMIVSHHPIVFRGLKRFTGADYVQRTVIKAIQSNVALYAIHTNLDNVFDGVNHRLATAVGCLPNSLQILRPKPQLLNQVAVFVPQADMAAVESAMFAAGAGSIGHYDECGFSVPGMGTFRPLPGATPQSGTIGERHHAAESRLEMVVESWKLGAVLEAMKVAHPYEEVAHSVEQLQNVHTRVGSGMLGMLENSVSESDFLDAIKKQLGCGAIRHTKLRNKKIQKVAVCGGSGSFLLADAMRAEADVFITSDFKYHEFFDADGRIVIADVGHYESEWQTTDLIVNRLNEIFPNFAVHLAQSNPNPIHYR